MTVPEPPVNVPVVFVKLVEIVIVPDVDVNVHPLIVRVPFTSIVSEPLFIDPVVQVIPALAVIVVNPVLHVAPPTVIRPAAVKFTVPVALTVPNVPFIAPTEQSCVNVLVPPTVKLTVFNTAVPQDIF